MEGLGDRLAQLLAHNSGSGNQNTKSTIKIHERRTTTTLEEDGNSLHQSDEISRLAKVPSGSPVTIPAIFSGQNFIGELPIKLAYSHPSALAAAATVAAIKFSSNYLPPGTSKTARYGLNFFLVPTTYEYFHNYIITTSNYSQFIKFSS